MTPEELFKPRYIQINDWPFMGDRHKIGKIYTYETEVESGIADAYPHLYRRLEWWEERKEEDMPRYVRWNSPYGGIEFFKVFNWLKNSIGVPTCNVGDAYLFIQNITPATEEEYNQFVHGKTDQ